MMQIFSPQSVIFKDFLKMSFVKVFHLYVLKFIKFSLVISGFSFMFRKAFPFNKLSLYE